MSSTPRTATRGGPKKPEAGKGHKSDGKKDGTKNNDAKKAHPTSERIAKITESVTDENILKIRIAQVIDIIHVTEDVAITALHDSDNDVSKAVSLILEGGGQGEWTTSGKKKKSKPALLKPDGGPGRGTHDGEIEDIDTQPLSANQDRDRSRGRGGGAPRGRGRGAGDRGGRGRDNKENEGGASGGEDGFRGPRGDRGDGFRRGGRGMSNGPGVRGGRGGRGGGGRLGSRMYGGRDGDRRDRDRDSQRFPSTIDTWNPSGAQEKTEPLKMETWGDSFPAAEDWDNEEYTGSLADTKVFTPSAVECATGSDPAADAMGPPPQAVPDFHQTTGIPASPLPVGSGTLSTAQAQYLTQLTQQSAEKVKANAAAVASAYGQTESLKSAVGIGAGTYAQSASYGQTASYGQPSYTPATYGAASTPYQSGTAYSATSATGANAFSSSASVQAGSFSAAQSAPSNAYSTATASASAYSSGSAPYQASIQNYQGGSNAAYGYSASTNSYGTQGYTPSSTYDGSTINSDVNAQSAQPQRVKTQRPRVPPPSKIPLSAVEMPEDASISVTSLDVQFGGLEFGSDGTTSDGVSGLESNSVAVDSVVASAGLDASAPSQSSLAAYSSNSSVSSQQASLVGGLTAKALASTDGLGLPSTEHKASYSSQSTRAVSSTSGLDLTKTDVSNLSYASAPSSAPNYSAYQNQKSAAYQPASYSTGSYTATATTYSSVPPNSYSTVSYSNQQSANTFASPSTYGSQPNASNYAAGATYPSTNSYPQSSQNYQSSSVYGNYSTGYQNSYSSSSVTAKLASGLTTTKEADMNNTASNLASGSTNSSSSATTTSTTASGSSSLLTSSSSVAVTTTSSSKISTGAMKSSVVPNLHPQMLGTPQYIMSGAGVPFYQTPVYGYEDVQLHQLQRIPHMATQYYDMGYSAPTSLAAGRETLPNVAFTMADARYSARADNAASPVPSTLSQQTATGAHQQPMMNHPSFPPGYTYVYNTVPGSFQYASPIFPVPSAGNAHAHATSSNQFAKPGNYGSSYGSGYEALNQTDYSKSPYVSSGVKSAVGGPSVTSSSTTSDLYGKAHTALGKVNSYDKQGFHSATPPPFNLATGQGTGMTTSGAYAAPQLFIPAMPPHQQHHNLIPSHLQDTSSTSGQRAQATSQAGKSVNKAYTPYWSAN